MGAANKTSPQWELRRKLITLSCVVDKAQENIAHLFASFSVIIVATRRAGLRRARIWNDGITNGFLEIQLLTKEKHIFGCTNTDLSHQAITKVLSAFFAIYTTKLFSFQNLVKNVFHILSDFSVLTKTHTNAEYVENDLPT